MRRYFATALLCCVLPAAVQAADSKKSTGPEQKLAAAKKTMQQKYESLNALLPDTDKPGLPVNRGELVNAQMLWSESVNSQCALAAELPGKPDQASAYAASCEARETGERSKVLAQWEKCLKARGAGCQP